MPKELVLIEDVFKQKNFKTMLKYNGLSKKTQVSGFKWNHWCSFFTISKNTMSVMSPEKYHTSSRKVKQLSQVKNIKEQVQTNTKQYP